MNSGISESEWQRVVVDAARLLGWRVFFVPDWLMRLAIRDIRQRRRGDRDWWHKGWPDLVLAHPDRGVIIAELKTDTGRVRPEQREWLDLFERVGIETAVWRPRMWGDIEQRLSSSPFAR